MIGQNLDRSWGKGISTSNTTIGLPVHNFFTTTIGFMRWLCEHEHELQHEHEKGDKIYRDETARFWEELKI